MAGVGNVDAFWRETRATHMKQLRTVGFGFVLGIGYKILKSYSLKRTQYHEEEKTDL